MKRVLSIFALFMGIFLLAACGGGENDPQGSKDNDKGGQQEETAFAFQFSGNTITMNMASGELLEKLGDPISLFEAPSCAFDGMDKIYSYAGFELHNYTASDKDYVSAVILKDDSVSTKEGVYIGEAKDKVIDTYGEDYKDEDGAYAYYSADSKLRFIFEENEIVSIEYIALEK